MSTIKDCCPVGNDGKSRPLELYDRVINAGVFLFEIACGGADK
jgi:hypothetical protein